MAACEKVGCRHVITWQGLAISTWGRIGYAMPKANGSLKQLRSLLPAEGIAEVAFQLVTGINELLYANYVHRDLKFDNLVIFDKSQPKPPKPPKLLDLGTLRAVIIDMGLGKQQDCHVTGLLDSLVGTMPFMPPELLRQLVVSRADLEKVDVWSLGLVIAQLAVTDGNLLVSLLHDKNVKELLVKEQEKLEKSLGFQGFAIAAGCARMPESQAWGQLKKLYVVEQVGMQRVLEVTGEVPAVMGELGMDLLLRMLQMEPGQRLSAREAWLHPYFTQQRGRLLAKQAASRKAFQGCEPLLDLLKEAKKRGKCGCGRRGSYKGSCEHCPP